MAVPTGTVFVYSGDKPGEVSTSFTSGVINQNPGTLTGTIPTKTTVPDHLLRHNISDEELEMLGQMRTIRTSESFWTSLGVGLSLIPTAVSNVYNAFIAEKAAPLSLLGLFETILCTAGLLIALALYLVGRMVSSTQDDIVSKIRARTAK